MSVAAPRTDRDHDLSVAMSGPASTHDPNVWSVRLQSVAVSSPRPGFIQGKSSYVHGDYRRLSALVSADDVHCRETFCFRQINQFELVASFRHHGDGLCQIR